MAEEKIKQEKKQEKKTDKSSPTQAEKDEKKRKFEEENKAEFLVRILGYDIPGSRGLMTGLLRIKGISWAISNAVCLKLNMPKNKKISDLSKVEIQQIEAFLRDLKVYDFMKNRRFDIETGETKHIFGSDLDVKREFDIKRLKEIKSYRGLRHSLRLPTRGQRTRSHFRSKGNSMGVKKKVK